MTILNYIVQFFFQKTQNIFYISLLSMIINKLDRKKFNSKNTKVSTFLRFLIIFCKKYINLDLFIIFVNVFESQYSEHKEIESLSMT